jgi:hypothetical protein
MPYTADKPKLAESSDELRARIPGWGVDLDPKDRPSAPKERLDPNLNGAHWDFPERQPEKLPRERSIEHKFLTPVFGTACPPKGLSGAIRKYAYRRYSNVLPLHSCPTILFWSCFECAHNGRRMLREGGD